MDISSDVNKAGQEKSLSSSILALSLSQLALFRAGLAHPRTFLFDARTCQTLILLAILQTIRSQCLLIVCHNFDHLATNTDH
jgi:DNA polymerase III epsilon subunit-like protein